MLDDLRGHNSLVSVAHATGCSRYCITRWLHGKTEPRLPDFLRVVEATSFRLLDLLESLVDPEQLPSVAADYRRLQLSRRAAYEVPWSQAVLRALELSDYQALPRHQPGWIAGRLGIGREAEEQALSLLHRSRQVVKRRGKFVPTEVRALDTRRDPARARRLREFWAEVATQRMRGDAEGVFAHNIFGVSAADYQRVRALQDAYYRELRALVAQSEPVERVVLANLQLLPLG